MWFLLRTGVGAVVLALAAYGLFFVEMGGKPLFDHVRDVWGSDVVQEKVALVRDGVRNELEDRLARVVEESARGSLAGGREHLHDDDRLRLEETLEQLADQPAQAERIGDVGGYGVDHVNDHDDGSGGDGTAGAPLP